MSEQRAEDIDDTALMAEVARGDTVAFERLIERHQALVIGTVGRMLGNNSEVEDVAQQVFIRVWKGAPRYRPTAKFTTWLLTITRNLVFNEARRRKRIGIQHLGISDENADRVLDFGNHDALTRRRIGIRQTEHMTAKPFSICGE